MPWPPPLSARWTALGLFLFALALHLFLALGGALIGADFKLLIVVDELGAILLAPLLFALLLRLSLRDAFLFRSAHWGHYLVAGATAIPVQLFGGALQELVLESMPGGDQWRELLERAMEPLLRTDGPFDLALLLFGGVVLAAVCEEMLFRGLLMQLLARGGRWWFAVWVSAILFAAFHLDFIGLLPRTLMGVYFGVLVWRSGSIFPAMVAHGANNLLAFAAVPFIDEAAGGAPSVAQSLLLAAGSGLVFVAMLAVYLRLTRATPPVSTPPPTLDESPAAGAAPTLSAGPAPTDTSTPPDSTDRTDRRES